MSRNCDVAQVATPPFKSHRRTIKARGDYQLVNEDKKVIALAHNNCKGHRHDDDDDDDNNEAEVVDYTLPCNPLVGQDHEIFAAEVAVAVHGGDFPIVGGGGFVPLCKGLKLTFVDLNFSDKDCRCGKSGCDCECAKGQWMPCFCPGDNSDIALTVDNLDDLEELDIEGFANGTQVSVTSLGGQVFVLSTTSTAAVNGSTVVATDSGTGRWLLVPSEGNLFLQLVQNGAIIV